MNMAARFPPSQPNKPPSRQSTLVFLGMLILMTLGLANLQPAPAAIAQLVFTETPTIEPALTPLPFDRETPTPEPTKTDDVPTETPIPEPTKEFEVTPIEATDTWPTPTPIESLAPTPTPTWEFTPTPFPVDLRGEYLADQIVVRLQPHLRAGVINQLADLVGGELKRTVPSVGVYVISVPTGSVAQAIALIQDHPAVKWVSPNYVTHAFYTPNDSYWDSQPNLPQIQVPALWDVTFGKTDTVVAVIDSGVDTSHADLQGKFWYNLGEAGYDDAGHDRGHNGLDDDANGYVDDVLGLNTLDDSANVNDDLGHGTQVAGLIAATTDNYEGLAGIAPNARIMVIKALAADGTGTYLQLAEGLMYAADHGARIINVSLGGDTPSPLLNEAINYAAARGALIVAAAGSNRAFPAAYSAALAVGAVDGNNQVAWFSASSRDVNVLAPGVGVLSTVPGGYDYGSGSSIAAAHVSGVAALLDSVPGFDSTAQIREALEATMLDVGSAQLGLLTGAGLVQAFDAANYYGPIMTPTPLPAALNVPAAQVSLWAQTSIMAAGCTATGAASAYSPQSFDGVTGSCLFTASGGTWTYNNLQNPNNTLAIYASASLLARFYLNNWVDDQILVEASNNGTTWTTLATYSSANPPPVVLTLNSYNVLPLIASPAQATGAQVRYRVVAVNTLDANLTVLSDQVRLDLIENFSAIPTPTAPAPAPTAVPGVNDPHVAYDVTTDKCSACHRGHTSAGTEIRGAGPEESNTCFLCHTVGGIGTNVQSVFSTTTNTSTRFFKHEITATVGLHRFDEQSGVNFGGANRHIECEDCHEPHDATRGTALAPMIQRVMTATSGVEPRWSGTSLPPTYAWLPQAQREHQVCLKCHSSFTSTPSYVSDGWTGSAYITNGLRKLSSTAATQVLDSRDLAQEFNPYNASFHPVIAQGRNQAMPVGGFVAGWSQTSLVYCSDCHTNAAPATGGVGPHGSPRLHILGGTANYTTVDTGNGAAAAINAGEICFKCHVYAVYAGNGAATNTLFRDGNQNLHNLHVVGERAPCYLCHDTHGSEQLHLINFDVSVVTPGAGLNSQTAWYPTATGGGCGLTCHGTNHNNWTYTR